MTVEQKLRLPFKDNYSVDIQIRIKKADRGYAAYVQGGVGSEHPIAIPITDDDVRDINSVLQGALQTVHGCFAPQNTGKQAKEEALSLLAEKGAYAFNRIFPAGPPRALIKAALERASGRVLEITSNDFLLPWEILYDRALDDAVDPLGFWGMRHIVSRSLAQSERPGDFVPAHIVSPRPRVGLVACHELTYVIDYEIPALEKMDLNGSIALTLLPALRNSDRAAELGVFKNFLACQREIIHFACHAYEKHSPAEAILRVEDTFDITIENFDTYEFDVKEFPLVILNACRTGTMDPGRTSNWASQLWRRGARGVVATEFRVPDWFAAIFVEQLYKRLLAKRNRKPLGESLMDARYHFWNEGRNPLGLAYALYSSPAIKFVGKKGAR